MTENAISKVVVGAALTVHKTLGGCGLLESVYEEALAWELVSNGLAIQRQLDVPLKYRGKFLSTPLRLDLLVEKKVILEVKAVATYNTIFEAQTLTYLRLMNIRLGIVINFGAKRVTDGIHRVVNGL